jgi:hypothetical protein
LAQEAHRIAPAELGRCTEGGAAEIAFLTQALKAPSLR